MESVVQDWLKKLRRWLMPEEEEPEMQPALAPAPRRRPCPYCRDHTHPDEVCWDCVRDRR